MQGGWVRNGISVDGAPPAEDVLVWWLQAPSKHCDLRLPYQGTDGLMSFAGTTTWHDPRLTWSPELELDPSVFEDVGVITWDGADMIETGSYAGAGRDIGYVERWQRLPGSDAELLALSRPGGRIVRTGPYAMTIVDARPDGGQFAAVAWTLDGDGWSVHHCWPPGAAAAPPPVQLDPATATVLLADGVEWTVDEAVAG